MLKKFMQGLLFGAGFSIAAWVSWYIGVVHVVPHIIEAALEEPEFTEPHLAKITQPEQRNPVSTREFHFFKDAGNRMQIPDGGGILSMSPMATASGSNRPSTYQLWLTHSELWQIRTIEDRVEVEQLPYPEGASVETLDSLMNENLGFNARQSTMTISAEGIGALGRGGDSWRDSSLNGKLTITTEGVVFVLPNPYES